jgi:hypothetical protein
MQRVVCNSQAETTSRSSKSTRRSRPENLWSRIDERDRNAYYDPERDLTVIAAEQDQIIVTTHHDEPNTPRTETP